MAKYVSSLNSNSLKLNGITLPSVASTSVGHVLTADSTTSCTWQAPTSYVSQSISTWSINLRFGSNSVSTLLAAAANYVKIGNLVFINGYVALLTKVGTGVIKISLPFQPSTDYGLINVKFRNGATYTGYTMLHGQVWNFDGYMYIIATNSDGSNANLTDTSIPDNSYIDFSGCYSCV